MAIDIRQQDNEPDPVLLLGAPLESESQFHTLLESLGEGIIFCDRDDLVLHVNTRMAELVGRHPHDMVGKPAEVVLLPPHNQNGFRDRTKRRLRGISEQYEIELIRNDGSLFWAKFNATPVRDVTGYIVGTLCAITDITDRKHAQAQLREREERFRLMADKAPVLIWASGPDSQCNYFNEVWLDFRGRTLSQEQNGGWIEGVHPEDREKCLQYYLEAFHARKHFRLLYRLQNRLGKYRWVLDHGVPWFGGDGAFLGYIGSCVDITEQKLAAEENTKLQRQLMQSQKMEAIGQLAAGVAHDLNNALAAVVGHLQLIDKNKGLPRELKPSVETAIRGCERALAFIDNLLGFARREQYSLQRLSLRQIVADTVEFLSPVIGSELNICFVGDGDDLPVLVDQNAIQQALTNLALNAKQATRERAGLLVFSFSSQHISHPELYNSSAKPGQYALLTIRDNGCGIAPELIDKIFEPFFTTKDNGQGTGLGLSMVYSIMQNHHGWVDVTSSLNQGTRFTLYFPLAPAVEQPLEIEMVGKHRSAPWCRVLIVDDEPQLIELMEQLLEDSGIFIHGCTSGRAAIDWYRYHHTEVDVVLLDMKMPEMDGVTCFAELKRIDREIKAAVLSGYLDDTLRTEMRRSGVLEIFQKPLHYQDLVTWLKTFITPTVEVQTASLSPVPSVITSSLR